MANLEGPIVCGGRAKRTLARSLYSERSVIAGLLDLGVRVVTLANNHILDVDEALGPTLSALAGAGIAHAGAGLEADAAWVPALVEDRGQRTWVIATGWTGIGCRPASESAGGVASQVPGRILESVSDLRRRYPEDRIVWQPHWNYELEWAPMPSHRDLAIDVLGAGADAVVGHHPHIVGPIEVFDDRPIAYSLGNWWLPIRSYFGGRMAPAEESKRQLALEIGTDGAVTCHFFDFDPNSLSITHNNSSPLSLAVDEPTRAPFAGMSSTEYESWFVSHRRHRCRGLPIFRSRDSDRVLAAKMAWLHFRTVAVSNLWLATSRLQRN